MSMVGIRSNTKVTEKVLAGVGETYDPQGATAIAVNPQDGAVLAMASWPPERV